MADPIIQIAGILDEAEARMLVENGVRRLGFPIGLDVHREDLPEEEAAAVIQALGLGPRAWLITYLDDPHSIATLCESLGCAGVQLHGPISEGRVAELGALRPGLQVIKSLIVRDGNLAELEARVAAFAPHVDGFITDTFDPATGASGATGKTHDWEVSRRLVELSPRPVILAGGLTPENVARAIEAVRPAGVDAHTGVEDEHGRKDPGRIRAFVAGAGEAFAAAGGNKRERS
ncbi:MAG: phosphoribosylanthranilate isomerase [Deltaproteobacteria bacterium]|nr:phosphoribosylanthranilate isomerase [Deltaproteobacteria bacterium]